MKFRFPQQVTSQTDDHFRKPPIAIQLKYVILRKKKKQPKPTIRFPFTSRNSAWVAVQDRDVYLFFQAHILQKEYT